MRHTHGEGVLFLALLSAVVACADSASRTVGLNASNNVQSAPTPSSSNSDERAALTTIARLTAMALDNEPARQHVKRDMRAAPFREHKLELATYLRSNSGKELLARMVSLNGGSESDLFGAVSGVRSLEFYMPVATQRETWTGSAEVLVASQLEETAPIIAFDASGREVSVDRSVAPTQPTLSIVPVETRFDRPMPALQSRNVRDQGGSAIGTLERVSTSPANLVASCTDTCGGTSSSSPPIPPGLYLEFSRILDMKEPWTRGDPEIEVHIQGPTTTAAPTYGDDLSCSGEHAYDYRKVFDQNTGFWEGRVLLFSPEEIAAYNSKFGQGFHILFWEDDNTACTLKLESNTLVEILKSTAAATSTVAIKVLPGASLPVVAGVFLGTFFSSAGSALLTNDDFVGAAVAQATSGYYYPDNTHVIMNGTTLNGRATIVYRQ